MTSPTGHPFDRADVAFWAVALAALATAMLAGCAPTRTVTIERPAPPPTVVTNTRIVEVASPPDTLYAERTRDVLVRDTVLVERTRTVPERVVVYREARPDTAQAFRLHALSVDSSGVVVFGRARDSEYRAPAPGETLVLRAEGPDSLSASVLGTPVAPPALVVDCPEPREAVIENDLGGLLRLALIILGAGLIGAVLGRLWRP